MTTHTLKRLPKATIEIIAKIPWNDIVDENLKSFDTLQQSLVVEGYRKGKVPKALAEKHIKKEAIFQQTIREMLPRVYEELVKKEGLKPIISPRVELIKAKENEEWEIKFSLAEKPTIELGDYKKYIPEAVKEAQKAEIWVPGKEEKPPEKKADENQQEKLNAALGAVLKHAKVEISELVIDEELNIRLSRLVDDVQKVGLTMDSYLKSRNLTIEGIKKQLAQEIEETYKLEFILMEVADKENIEVQKADIDGILGSIKDEKERQNAAQNAYYYASILRKQKTLEFLTSL